MKSDQSVPSVSGGEPRSTNAPFQAVS